MNKTQASLFVENVSGVIIGGDHLTGQLYYDGRPQGPHFYGTDDEVKTQAKAQSDQWKQSWGAEYQRLYPSGLELRIW